MSGNNGSSGSEGRIVDSATLRRGLKAIRRRRWYLWTIILAYMPLMMVAMKIFSSVIGAFISWFVVMFAIALFAATARCPGCGNYFHLHGMTLLYLRKCLHCQLHVCADKHL